MSFINSKASFVKYPKKNANYSIIFVLLNIKNQIIMKRLLLLLGILLIVNNLISCKKDDEQPTKEELLTAHKWYGIDSKIYTNGTETSSSQKDDSFLFKNNHEYSHYDDNGDLDETGKWKIIEGSPDIIKFYDIQEVTMHNSKHVFRAYLPTYSFELKIEKLNEDYFSFYLEFTNSDNDNVKVVLNYKK